MNTSKPSTEERLLLITPDSTLRFIWEDALSPLLKLGESVIERASYVEPEGTEWYADLHPAGGPKLGPFSLRQQALTAEINWLTQNQLGD